MSKVKTTEEALKLIPNNAVIGSGGFIGMCYPHEITLAMEESYLKTGAPSNLTIICASGLGDGTEKYGLNRLAHDGMLKRVVAGHWNLIPSITKLALEDKFEAYNLPQGVIVQMFRETAAHRPGVITKTGLKTFVDPDLDGGKLNDRAKNADDLVEHIKIHDEDYLLYKAIPIDVAILRGTFADERGNVVMSKEAAILDNLAIAQAARNSNGKVIVQVEKVVKSGTLNPKDVVIPGELVDAIIISKPENHWQTYASAYKPEYCGEAQVPSQFMDPMSLDARKVISRRCALELKEGDIINLGIGMPEGVASVANEEGLPHLNLTVEAGSFGGIPNSGVAFGSVTNATATIDEPSIFDFYDGGGLDCAFLGLAECSESGDINVSRFGPRIAGCGGFINISQSTPTVVFCGTFTAKGLKEHLEDDRLVIDQEGAVKKFKKSVEQITFSSEYARSSGQRVLYVTERAVFELMDGVFTLTEIAPGVELEKDILLQMEFTPAISKNVRLMDERIFREERMGLSCADRKVRDEETERRDCA